MFREKYGIEARTGIEVTDIDLDRREVVTAHGRERFDKLVYAAGAVPVTPGWARVDAAGVFSVQTLDDGAAVGTRSLSPPEGRPPRSTDSTPAA